MGLIQYHGCLKSGVHPNKQYQSSFLFFFSSHIWIFGRGDLAQPTDSKTYPVWLTHLSPIESVLGFGPWFVICYSETINFQNWVHHTDKSTTMVDPRGVYVGEFYQIVVHTYEEFCWALILLWCTHVKAINECQACIFQSTHVGGGALFFRPFLLLTLFVPILKRNYACQQ